MGGIMLEADYPYTGGSPACAFNIDRSVTQPVGIWTGKGEAQMIERIFQQPITVAIDAGAYKSYRSGTMGCNAGGKGQVCRFCGFGQYGEIPCPSYLTDALSLAENCNELPPVSANATQNDDWEAGLGETSHSPASGSFHVVDGQFSGWQPGMGGWPAVGRRLAPTTRPPRTFASRNTTPTVAQLIAETKPPISRRTKLSRISYLKSQTAISFFPSLLSSAGQGRGRCRPGCWRMPKPKFAVGDRVEEAQTVRAGVVATDHALYASECVECVL